MSARACQVVPVVTANAVVGGRSGTVTMQNSLLQSLRRSVDSFAPVAFDNNSTLTGTQVLSGYLQMSLGTGATVGPDVVTTVNMPAAYYITDTLLRNKVISGLNDGCYFDLLIWATTGTAGTKLKLVSSGTVVISPTVQGAFAMLHAGDNGTLRFTYRAANQTYYVSRLGMLWTDA
jgi:hypothetical protein